MKKMLIAAATLAVFGIAPIVAQASTPQEDLKAFREYFVKRFPGLPFAEFANGAYAVGPKDKREQWEAIEEFPPYDIQLDKGKKEFNTPFANGKTYSSCFKNGGIGIRQNYPYFDRQTGQVRTLEMDINACREKNGEKALKYGTGEIAELSAYMAYTSRGKKLHVLTPKTQAELAAYNKGKFEYYAKRGQLNFSCADCHMYNSGNRIRANTLSPSLGQPTGFPVYRAKKGHLLTFENRFKGCNKNVRAKPFKEQSEEYRDLEYFLTYMSNGQPVNAPSYRE
ncbi:MAG TPA: sulfur oxidation c-type cytochrome SoxA [Gammaproteobacteria bacterium]|nr:sulfur oxidation c-type cytochrome SoxA [Gammaproteobacteria bacterium]